MKRCVLVAFFLCLVLPVSALSKQPSSGPATSTITADEAMEAGDRAMETGDYRDAAKWFRIAAVRGQLAEKVDFPRSYPPKITIEHSQGVNLVPQEYIQGIPDVRQMDTSACGAASFQGVVNYFGFDARQLELEKILGTNDDGTNPLHIFAALKKLGLAVTYEENMTIDQLKKHIQNKDVVMIEYQAWPDTQIKDYANDWEDGHFSIAVGYNDQVLFIEDPSLLGTVGYVSWKEFAARWHDYDMTDGKRVNNVHLGIVVRGKRFVQPPFTHID